MNGALLLVKLLGLAKDHWRPILIGIFAVLLITFMPLSILTLFPSAEESKINMYQKIGMVSDLNWGDILIYDTIKNQNNFEKVNPYNTAYKFLTVTITKYKYEQRINEKGEVIGYDYVCVWSSTASGQINIKKLLSRVGYNQASFEELFNALKSLENNDMYSISVQRKTIDDFLHEFNEDELEWIKNLQDMDIANNLYGDFSGDYDIPVIDGVYGKKELIAVVSSILDHPYGWGGKSPYKGPPKNPLDCSGYVDWVYIQLVGKTVGNGGGTGAQISNTVPVSEGALRVGDLGFYNIGNSSNNHVGIYIGEDNGKKLFIHSGGSSWGTSASPTGKVVITYNNVSGYYKGNRPSFFKYYRRVAK